MAEDKCWRKKSKAASQDKKPGCNPRASEFLNGWQLPEGRRQAERQESGCSCNQEALNYCSRRLKLGTGTHFTHWHSLAALFLDPTQALGSAKTAAFGKTAWLSTMGPEFAVLTQGKEDDSLPWAKQRSNLCTKKRERTLLSIPPSFQMQWSHHAMLRASPKNAGNKGIGMKSRTTYFFVVKIVFIWPL